jgi:hypothetical protein
MRLIASSALACLLATAASAAYAADPEPTLQLGTVQVQGNEQIIQTLHAIKLALHTPFSDSAEHADDVVCRVNKELGDPREYLDCSTNRDYTRRRDATQVEILKSLGNPLGANLLAMFIAIEPDHRVHTAVNGAALHALLDHIPDVLPDTQKRAIVPAATTQKAPASATSQPTTQW